MKRLAWVVAAALACGPSVKSVSIDPPRAALDARGATVQLRATALDARGRPVAEAGAKPAWTSSAPLVASVDDTGRVTALRSGEATIAAVVGEARGTAQIAVAVPTTVTVTPSELRLPRPGARASLAVQVTDDAGRPVAAPASVAWTSSDPAVARVAAGEVTATGGGTAVVTASIGAVEGQARVSVKAPEFAKLAVKPARLALVKAGATARLRATARDRKGRTVEGVPVTWKSSNVAVAAVGGDGTVTAKRKGRARVTATAAGKSASVQVTVKR